MKTLISLSLLAAFGAAHANIVIQFVETPTTVDVTATGSLNVASFSLVGTSNWGSFAYLVPSFGAASLRSLGESGTLYAINGYNVAPFGSVNSLISGTRTGVDQFSLERNGSQTQIILPTNYVSGTQLSAGATFNRSFASLGITNFSDIVNTLPDGQTITYRFTPVPEPATMTALALGAAALLRRRKKSA